MSTVTSRSAISQSVMLWGAVLALAAWRFSIAADGKLGEAEALLAACAAHPAGGYVEGAAGMPLLLAINALLFGTTPAALRWFSPAALLLLSWCGWWLARRLAPHRPSVALWSVLAINLMPLITVASLVMDGAMVTAALILCAVAAAWHAIGCKEGKVLPAWGLFGFLLGLGTLFFYPLGWLLPAAIIARLLTQGGRHFPWRGLTAATGLLLLGWVFPIAWNARHDWIQWSSVAPGFDALPPGLFSQLSYLPLFLLGISGAAALGGMCLVLRHAKDEPAFRTLLLLALPFLMLLTRDLVTAVRDSSASLSLGLVIAVSALMIPPAVSLALTSRGWRWTGGLLLGAAASLTLLLLALPSGFPTGFSSPEGVRGVGTLARAVVTLREERHDAIGEKPILIASTPGLAALLGNLIRIDYPERPGSPSVFAGESPSLSSSYALWPSYPDAVGAGIKDALYTEEKSTSPFLGRNALYITTETPAELPQTIKGAFAAVGLLKEMELTWNGRPVIIRIYQCEDYRTLSL